MFTAVPILSHDYFSRTGLIIHNMDNYCSKESSVESQFNLLKQQKILKMSNFIATALEFLPISRRALVFRDIQRIQDWYRSGSETYLGKHTILSIQLMRIEHYKMNPEYYDDPDNRRYYVPRSYGEAMMTYVASIPVINRDHVLSAICRIISHVTTEFIT